MLNRINNICSWAVSQVQTGIVWVRNKWPTIQAKAEAMVRRAYEVAMDHIRKAVAAFERGMVIGIETVEKRQAMPFKEALAEAKAAGAVTVHVRGGRYELAQPLEFTATDSGAKERPVTWCAYEDEKPVVSGGTLVTGWRRHDERLWAADVPWVRERGRPFYQLFVNGQRRVRARMPNEGSYFYTKRLRLTNAAHPLCLGMTYHESDLAALQDAAQATVVLFHNWVNSFNRIGQLERERHRKLAHKAFVWGMYVAPEARRTGVGRRLMETTMGWLHSGPWAEAILWTLPGDHRAARFYRSWGWAPDGGAKTSHTPLGPLDEVRYRITL